MALRTGPRRTILLIEGVFGLRRFALMFLLVAVGTVALVPGAAQARALDESGSDDPGRTSAAQRLTPDQEAKRIFTEVRTNRH